MADRISKVEAVQQVNAMIEEFGYLPVLEMVADWIDRHHPTDGVNARVSHRLRVISDAGTMPPLEPPRRCTCRACSDRDPYRHEMGE